MYPDRYCDVLRSPRRFLCIVIMIGFKVGTEIGIFMVRNIFSVFKTDAYAFYRMFASVVLAVVSGAEWYRKTMRSSAAGGRGTASAAVQPYTNFLLGMTLVEWSMVWWHPPKVLWERLKADGNILYLPPGVVSKYAQTVCIFALWATLHKISSSTDLLQVRKLSTPEREKIDRHCAAAAGTAAGTTPTVLPWYRRALLFRSAPLDRTLRTRVFVVSLVTFLTDVLLVSSLYPMVCVLINGWKWGVLEAGIGTTT